MRRVLTERNVGGDAPATATAARTVAIGNLVEVTFTNVLTGVPTRVNLTLLFA